MIDRLTRIQLTIFAMSRSSRVTAMAIFYLRLPAAFGIGTYKVDAEFRRRRRAVQERQRHLPRRRRSAGWSRWG